ncbi:MAG: NifU family protein [Synergistaceae bacterium]|nr:NifU family protein [Synergistaceae bacterium]
MASSATIESIERVLDSSVRPILRGHGGDIGVVSFEEGVLKVRMQGNCNNCPSAVADVEQLAATEIQAAVPEVKRVVPVTGVSDELLEMARALMKNR